MNREDGLNEVSGLLIVPTKTTSTLVLERELPASVIEQQPNGFVYQLDIRKQPGISQLPFLLKVLLPEGASVATAETNIPMSKDGDGWVWKNSIVETSTSILVSFK